LNRLLNRLYQKTKFFSAQHPKGYPTSQRHQIKSAKRNWFLTPSTLHQASHSQPLTSFTSVNFQTMHLQSLLQILDDVMCHTSNHGESEKRKRPQRMNTSDTTKCVLDTHSSVGSCFFRWRFRIRQGTPHAGTNCTLTWWYLRSLETFSWANNAHSVYYIRSSTTVTDIWEKKLMDRALCQGCIAPEQYSRPTRSAIDHALNRRLTFDHQFYTRCPFCLGCCDLMGCYDRILHTIAALVLRKVGVSKA